MDWSKWKKLFSHISVEEIIPALIVLVVGLVVIKLLLKLLAQPLQKRLSGSLPEKKLHKGVRIRIDGQGGADGIQHGRNLRGDVEFSDIAADLVFRTAQVILRESSQIADGKIAGGKGKYQKQDQNPVIHIRTSSFDGIEFLGQIRKHLAMAF